MDIRLWDFEVNEADHLVIEGCDVVDLAEEFGTPLHVVSKNKLLRNYRDFLRAFEKACPDIEVAFSYKTNCIPGILKILHEEGAGAEVISPYELWLAFQLGVSPERIIYNGVNKTPESLELAVKKGIKLINVDALSEIDMLESIAKACKQRVKVGVRVRPPVNWKAHFGCDIGNGNAYTAYENIVRSEYLCAEGIHFHIGTGITKPILFLKAIDHVTTLLKKLKDQSGLELKYFDIGGGIGVPTAKAFNLLEFATYRGLGRLPHPPRAENCPSLQEFAHRIVERLQLNCRKYGISFPKLLCEPGRAISSSAQILLITVRTLKEKYGGINYAISEGGPASIAFPNYAEYHEVFPANSMSATPERTYRVTGQVCTPFDALYLEKKLPKLRVGDILAVMDAGAYFTSYSNNFSFPRPAIVLVSNGKAEVIRKRETFEHLIRMDKW